jgi:chaperone modulatory protein CbpM
MQPADMIPATEFCIHHKIELSFIHLLKQHGLIETVVIEESVFLPLSELERLEKIVRLHFELDINLEGIETINHLLQRITTMQEHIVSLTNRLKAREDD